MKKLYSLSFAVLALCGLSLAQTKTAAWHFNGNDGMITIPHNSALDLGSGEFTIEAWIQADAGTAAFAPTIVCKKQDGPNSNGWFMGLNGNNGFLSIEMKGVAHSGSDGNWGSGEKAKDLRDGQCHHVAYVRELGKPGATADTLMAYQDGNYIRRSRDAVSKDGIDSDHDVSIGWTTFNTQSDGYQFNGMIKEVRIWKVAKTESEIKASMNKHLTGSEAGLVAYWRVNENDGSSVKDHAGTNNGTITGGGMWDEFCDVLDDLPGGVGITENNQVSVVSVFPNPAEGFIQMNGIEFSAANVDIYDMNGRVVLQRSLNYTDRLDVSTLQSGVYMLLLQTNDGESYRSTFNVK